MSSSDPPPAPDYSGAAQQTAASNLQNSIASQQGSMVNQQTPYGSLNYTQSGAWDGTGNPQYTATTNLNPQAQQTLDTQMKLSNEMGNLTQAQVDNVNQQYSTPMDMSSVNDVYQKSYDNQANLLDQTWKPAEQSQETALANQGLQPGEEAYTRAMNTFNTGKNNAYQGAVNNAISTMPQTYQLGMAQYEQPLNQLNALRTGAQVQGPQFANTPQQQLVGGANQSAATQAAGQYGAGLYNAQVGQDNANTATGAGLATAALTAIMMM